VHKSIYDRVIDLLHEKIFYLDRFLEISASEQKNFRARNFDNLESLYASREELLSNIITIDKHIFKISHDAAFTPLEKEGIQSAVGVAASKVKFILEEDLTLISFVEKEKSLILREVGKTSSGRRAIKGYRSKSPTEV